MAEQNSTQPNFLDRLGGWLNQVGGIVDKGTSFYSATMQRIKALKSIDDDEKTGTSESTGGNTVINPTQNKNAEWVMPALAVGLVLIGIIVARKS